MTLRTLALITGVGLATLALPATTEARHRHSRSSRHYAYSQVQKVPGYAYQGYGYYDAGRYPGYGYQGYGYYDADRYSGYGYYSDEPAYVYAPVRVRPRCYVYRPRVRHLRPRLHLRFGW